MSTENTDTSSPQVTQLVEQLSSVRADLNEIRAATDDTPAPIRGMARNEVARNFLSDDRPVVYVHCPEWGGHIKLVAMTGDQAERFSKAREKDKEGTGMYDIISACAVDEQGAKLFPDPGVLRGRSLSVLNRLQNAALKLNGFREEAAAEAKKA